MKVSSPHGHASVCVFCCIIQFAVMTAKITKFSVMTVKWTDSIVSLPLGMNQLSLKSRWNYAKEREASLLQKKANNVCSTFENDCHLGRACASKCSVSLDFYNCGGCHYKSDMLSR